MSTYAFFDDSEESFQVASNLGWSEFGTWVNGLNAEEFPNLVQLWEHGTSADPTECAKQLESALEKYPPEKDVADTAELF